MSQDTEDPTDLSSLILDILFDFKNLIMCM